MALTADIKGLARGALPRGGQASTRSATAGGGDATGAVPEEPARVRLGGRRLDGPAPTDPRGLAAYVALQVARENTAASKASFTRADAAALAVQSRDAIVESAHTNVLAQASRMAESATELLS
jgi:hypothetical protein